MKLGLLVVLVLALASLFIVGCSANDAPEVNTGDTGTADLNGGDEVTDELDAAFEEEDVEIGEII